MFCVQFKTAVVKLIAPPTVDSTYERNITENDLPLITVCPENQVKLEKLRELGYEYLLEFLDGNTNCIGNTKCTSWGAHKNLSFNQALREVYTDGEKSTVTATYDNYTTKVVYLAKFGFCLEISRYDPCCSVEIDNLGNHSLRVLITDRNSRSYFMVDIASHIGEELILQPNKFTNIDVEVKTHTQCKSDQNGVKDDNFYNCVDDEIQKIFENSFGCIPPWLSSNNQCNKTYPRNQSDSVPNFYWDYLWPVYTLSNNKIEAKCKNSCRKTKFYVHKRETIEDKGWSGAFVKISQKMVVTEKVVNYDLFQFIIDVGSSLGLWLGLSVLGLHELVVEAVQSISNSSIWVKLRSAFKSKNSPNADIQDEI